MAVRSACATAALESVGTRRSRVYGRCSVRVERGDRRQAPCLSSCALGLGPGDRLPVGREHQPGAGVAQLDPVTAGLIDIQEKGLLDRVLVRAGLDEYLPVDADVGGLEYVFSRIGRECDVVQPSIRLGPVVGIDEVVGLLREMQPLG